MNPSFEIHSTCPVGLGDDVIRASGWDTCRGSADYFEVCGAQSFCQVPRNFFGNQQPANGSAYCGLYTYTSSGFYREIIVGQLLSPLITNQKYYISFKVSRGDSNYTEGYSTNKMGAKMSVSRQNNVSINNISHYASNLVITDTINWVKLFGSFVADSAYKYIMIGNFFDDSHTTIINDGNGSTAYYYVDEICLSSDSMFAENYVTDVKTYLKENQFDIFPNPANSFFNIKGINDKTIKIFNNLGFVRDIKIEINNTFINCSTWSEGMYYIQTARHTYKLIINH